jgi:hypothetical protein
MLCNPYYSGVVGSKRRLFRSKRRRIWAACQGRVWRTSNPLQSVVIDIVERRVSRTTGAKYGNHAVLLQEYPSVTMTGIRMLFFS